eukprot:scaffold16926_cov59-Attheya_sp.AAC.3
MNSLERETRRGYQTIRIRSARRRVSAAQSAEMCWLNQVGPSLMNVSTTRQLFRLRGFAGQGPKKNASLGKLESTLYQGTTASSLPYEDTMLSWATGTL